ncbi:MAG TPA: hypothetical protein VI386_01790, partial [Candidatus Sulfotelmatobacter sp.]
GHSKLLRDITPEAIQVFVNSWKLSPKTLHNVIAQMRAMWDIAVAWGQGDFVPTDNPNKN